MSSAMRVSIDSVQTITDVSKQPVLDLPLEMVLKVYDRRFAHLLREQHALDPATYESEKAYRRYLEADNVPDWESTLQILKEDQRSFKDCPKDLVEHYIMFLLELSPEDEFTVYNRLADLQGRDIPIFFGKTELIEGLPIDERYPPVRGILLEFIPGIPLDSIDPAKVDVDAVFRNAIRIIDTYSDLGVLNEDVHLGNFILKPNGSVVMIDFAQSRLREDDETDEKWRYNKHMADEEGAVGHAAKRYYNWDYKRRLKYSKFNWKPSGDSSH
ncbi:hypothetical protein RhiJN_20748 [Ceratobasidium sp. AG-Ba]|nr:hypothetical protein RhiJN_20748 [Ceratobasidium sp. AG-Ba]